MAKDLPYFKFIVNEWITGDITLEDLNVQGLFINLCAWYWSKECTLSLENAKKKFSNCKAIAFENLENSGAIKVNEHGFIIINFLDEQFEEFKEISEKRSLIGKLGGRGNKAIANQEQSNSFSESKQNKAKREEKKREEERREEERKQEGFSDVEVLEKFPFEEFWNTYDKKNDRVACEKKFNKLTEKEKELIWQHVPKYVLSTPDKQYRKNPETYLNNKCWNDEIITNSKNATGKQPTTAETLFDRANKRAAERFANSKGD